MFEIDGFVVFVKLKDFCCDINLMLGKFVTLRFSPTFANS